MIHRGVVALGTFATSALIGLVHPDVAHADEPQSTWKTTVSEEQMAEAKNLFKTGVRLLDDPDGARYEDAYRAFKRAYEISHTPKILSNIGFCALHLERDGEAIDAYTGYLRDEQNIDEGERKQIQQDLDTLKSAAVRAQFKVKDRTGSFTLVDRRVQTRGNPIENEYTFDTPEIALRLHPGRHSIKVRNGGKESTPLEVTLDPGAEATYELTFPPDETKPAEGATQAAPPPPQSASILGPVIVGGAGLAALALGVITASRAMAIESDIAGKCPNDICPADYDLEKDRSSVKTFGTVTDISFIAGGVLLTSAIVWYAILPKSAARAASAVTSSTSAGCGPTGCGLQLRRSF